jgi:hypothetical protein
MKWVGYVVAAVVGLVAVVAVIGVSLPQGHRASRSMTYAASPEVVFGVISDVAHYADWREGVTRIEMLPDEGGATMFREHGEQGPILYRVEVATPPTRMRTRIADTSLEFGGTWTYELGLTPTGGTMLTITEDGEVYNPIFRFMARYVFSPTATIEGYQRSLARKLGEAQAPAISD